jgi:hypothetical protein
VDRCEWCVHRLVDRCEVAGANTCVWQPQASRQRCQAVRQFLYFCTSKASKVRVRVCRLEGASQQNRTSVFVRWHQYLFFGTSKARKLSTRCRSEAPEAPFLAVSAGRRQRHPRALTLRAAADVAGGAGARPARLAWCRGLCVRWRV